MCRKIIKKLAAKTVIYQLKEREEAIIWLEAEAGSFICLTDVGLWAVDCGPTGTVLPSV
jgi:hypothetical protein